MKQITVFFGCSMRGGHGIVAQAKLRALQQSIEDVLGYSLASKHQTQEGILAQENQLSPSVIHDRDWEFLAISDVCVFEISNPSLGVGGEISDALHLGKPVLCLYSSKNNEVSISGYIRGKAGSKHVNAPFEHAIYSDTNDALLLIRQFAEKYAR